MYTVSGLVLRMVGAVAVAAWAYWALTGLDLWLPIFETLAACIMVTGRAMLRCAARRRQP